MALTKTDSTVPAPIKRRAHSIAPGSKPTSWPKRCGCSPNTATKAPRLPPWPTTQGLSKQNLMYYFPTKQALYERVLDGVLDEWLERMDCLADPEQDPSDVLRAYIQAKLRFSREQPWASRVYAMEVISGAQLYGEQIQKRVVPLLRKDIEVFERWIDEGRIAPINATHLLFAIWAMTQSYADFSTQMSLVLNRKQLSKKDFDDGETMITNMVLAAVALPS